VGCGNRNRAAAQKCGAAQHHLCASAAAGPSGRRPDAQDPESDGDFALDLRGSAFELKVWNALREIPAGTTATYGEIAARVGSPREAREVGEACAANRLAVVVPCHRIVKKDGSISGYRWGVRRKRALLEREHGARLLRPSEAVPHGAAST
jgi:AraC family transcriptional regulator of adaptative response/methylated-DNA-[protein]-cysteine methyltransferase